MRQGKMMRIGNSHHLVYIPYFLTGKCLSIGVFSGMIVVCNPPPPPPSVGFFTKNVILVILGLQPIFFGSNDGHKKS